MDTACVWRENVGMVPSAVLRVVLVEVDCGETASCHVADVPREGDVGDVGVGHGGGDHEVDGS